MTINSTAPMLVVVDTEETSRIVMSLYPEIYRLLGRRLELGARRPGQGALAVLGHLAQSGPVAVCEAAAHFGRSQAATSELVNRLEARGLVERMRDERDRRRHLVWLTPAGLRTLRAARRVLDPELVGRAVGRLPEEARAGLVTGLQALVHAARPVREEDDDAHRDDV